MATPRALFAHSESFGRFDVSNLPTEGPNGPAFAHSESFGRFGTPNLPIEGPTAPKFRRQRTKPRFTPVRRGQVDTYRLKDSLAANRGAARLPTAAR